MDGEIIKSTDLEPKVRVKLDQDAKGFVKIEVTARGDTIEDATKTATEALVETRKLLAIQGIAYLVPGLPVEPKK